MWSITIVLCIKGRGSLIRCWPNFVTCVTHRQSLLLLPRVCHLHVLERDGQAVPGEVYTSDPIERQDWWTYQKRRVTNGIVQGCCQWCNQNKEKRKNKRKNRSPGNTQIQSNHQGRTRPSSYFFFSQSSNLSLVSLFWFPSIFHPVPFPRFDNKSPESSTVSLIIKASEQSLNAEIRDDGERFFVRPFCPFFVFPHSIALSFPSPILVVL